MTKLIIPTEGVCATHKCDLCAICRAGRCCRRDNPERKLPAEGSWQGPMYGEIGVLEHDPAGEKVRCHCCGQFYTVLGKHTFWAHDLDSAEYRATFGLRQQTALAGKRHCESVRVRNADLLPRIRPAVNPIATMTPEQHSALAAGRRLPAESKNSPSYRAGVLRAGAISAARAAQHTCKCGCGALLPPGNGPHRGQRYLPGHVPPTLADRVLATLVSVGRPLPVAELLAVHPEGHTQVRRALVKLVRLGRAQRTARGLYQAIQQDDTPVY